MLVEVTLIAIVVIFIFLIIKSLRNRNEGNGLSEQLSSMGSNILDACCRHKT